MEQEIWKDIKGYEGFYKCSNLGKVYSFLSEKEIGTPNKKYKYIIVSLHKNGLCNQLYKHVIIAITFLGHIPNGQTKVINHINGDTNDNRLCNLEIITQRENVSKEKRKKMDNTSKYTGVYFSTSRNRWISQIVINRRRFYIGSFKTEIEAYNSYKKKLLLL